MTCGGRSTFFPDCRLQYDKDRHDPSKYRRQHQEYEPLAAELQQPAGSKEACAKTDIK